MMRRLKLEAWYDKHEHCPDGDHDWEQFCEDWPESPNCRDFDEWLARGKPSGFDEDDDDDDDDYEGEEIPF